MGARSDPAKDTINREKHHLPLAFGEKVVSDTDRIEVTSPRAHADEERIKAIGVVGDKV